MLRDGVVHPWRPEDFGDQFIFLAMEQLYDAHTGLNWQDYGDLGTMIV